MGRTVLEVEPPRGPPSSSVQSNRPFADRVFLEVEPPPGPQLPSRSPASEPPSPQASKSTSFSQHLFHQDLDFHDPDKTMTYLPGPVLSGLLSSRTSSVRTSSVPMPLCLSVSRSACLYAPLTLSPSVSLPLLLSVPLLTVQSRCWVSYLSRTDMQGRLCACPFVAFSVVLLSFSLFVRWSLSPLSLCRFLRCPWVVFSLVRWSLSPLSFCRLPFLRLSGDRCYYARAGATRQVTVGNDTFPPKVGLVL